MMRQKRSIQALDGAQQIPRTRIALVTRPLTCALTLELVTGIEPRTNVHADRELDRLRRHRGKMPALGCTGCPHRALRGLVRRLCLWWRGNVVERRAHRYRRFAVQASLEFADDLVEVGRRPG